MDNNEVLSKLHNVLLELLCEFDRICKKHNIQYFLDSGTALGAIRHGGFIPWDDDLDVGMMRDDYNKFLKVAFSEVGEKYVVLTKEVDPAYNKYHAKLVRKNTIYPEPTNKNYKYRGISIDIFPFDKISNDLEKRRNDFKIDLFYKRVIGLKKSKKNRTSILKISLHYLLKFLPMSLLEKRLYNLWTQHNDTESSYVTCYLYRMLLKRSIVFPKSLFLPVKQINFEGGEYPIMKNYEEYLSLMYGDYMKLPPENEREFHLCGDVVFDKD